MTKELQMSNRINTIISVFALAIALTSAGAWAKTNLITTKQIKNGTISTKDLKNNNVGTADLKDGTVGTQDIGSDAVTDEDIGANQVTPQDVKMPAACQKTGDDGGAAVPVSASSFERVFTAGTCPKEQAESLMKVEWSGAVASGASTNCVFQLRVNGLEALGGGAEVFAGSSAANVATSGLFSAPAGTVSIEVWAKANVFVPGGGPSGPSCVVGPTGTVDSTFVASEEVV
jgi:hypothetical protein